jgi:uncharacterized membrane protein
MLSLLVKSYFSQEYLNFIVFRIFLHFNNFKKESKKNYLLLIFGIKDMFGYASKASQEGTIEILEEIRQAKRIAETEKGKKVLYEMGEEGREIQKILEGLK